MSNKLNGFNDGISPSSGVGGSKSPFEWIQEVETKTTQLSGLSDYELFLDGVADKVMLAKSSLERIGILRKLVEDSKNEAYGECDYDS